jgi:hypothetical protein
MESGNIPPGLTTNNLLFRPNREYSENEQR